VLALEFPAASREKVANVLLGRGGRGGGGAGAVGAVAEDIARAAVQVEAPFDALPSCSAFEAHSE
jgi:hypothetical protein